MLLLPSEFVPINLAILEYFKVEGISSVSIERVKRMAIVKVNPRLD